MKLNTIEGLFFLSFFTELSIIKIYNLVAQYSTLDELLKDNSSLNSDYISLIMKKANQSYEKTIFNNIKIIPYYDENYPKKLNVLRDKPPLLFLKGNYNENKKLINIVGTRANSEYGAKLTNKIVNLLVNNSFGITSGLALGIDTIAHKTTLENEDSYTISILPTALNTIYPKENYSLANKILKNNGALISEIPIDLSLGKRKFVQRNRLQAALSDITIPVEFNKTSGTMHTVKFTFEQNKKVILIKPIKHDNYLENFNEIVSYLKNNRNKKYQENLKIVENSEELLKEINSDKKNAFNQFQKSFTF